MGLNHTKAASGGHKLLPDFSSCSNFNPWFEKIVYIYKDNFIKHHQCFQKKCLYIYRQFFLNSTHVLKKKCLYIYRHFFSNFTHVLRTGAQDDPRPQPRTRYTSVTHPLYIRYTSVTSVNTIITPVFLPSNHI